MKRTRRVTVLAMLALGPARAVSGVQAADTLAQDGIYARPFIGAVSSTSIGGYVEGNTNYFVQDGVADGFSMELRRFNVFLFSQVSPRLRLLAELEFEHGTEEIALETALVDLRIRPELVLCAGIILPPLGVFLQVGFGGHFWLNILLTLFGYLPGIIHAVWVIASRK